MSTWERSVNVLGKCPCGHGVVRECVESPDNSWSKTQYEYELDCPACAIDWRIDDHGRLTNKADAAACTKASMAVLTEKAVLAELHGKAIDTILREKQISNPKDERALLASVGLCEEGPIRYKRFRKSGKSPGSLCDPTRNLQWILSELVDQSLRTRIVSQIEKIKRFEDEDQRVRKSMQVTSRDMRAERAAQSNGH